MVKKIEVHRLLIGMYIHQMDRHYLETPFLTHRFHIKTPKQLGQLQKFCRYVYIDTEKGIEPKPIEEPVKSELPKKDPSLTGTVKKKPDRTASPKGINFRLALKVRDQAKKVIHTILEEARVGQSINTVEARKAVDSIIENLMEDENALLCLAQLRTRDEYTAVHSINVSTLSIAFGKQLGWEFEELQLIGLGGLLHDIGKMKIPLEILNKPGRLTESEFEIMKNHVLLSRDILEKAGDFPTKAMEVVLQHHERVNGKGYPFGLTGDQIDAYGRVAAIVDVYDAMTSDRVYRNAMPQHEAVKKIYEWGSSDFDQSLVDQFIKMIGIYPIGSMVEINHSDIGMVVANNQENILKPSILLLLDNRGQKYRPPRLIDLTEKLADFNRPIWTISKILGPAKEDYLSPLLQLAA